MRRLVKIEVQGTSGFCLKKCNWWGAGFGGRGAVCSLFEQVLEKSGEDFARVKQCKQQEVSDGLR